jgi:hypothetical protein
MGPSERRAEGTRAPAGPPTTTSCNGSSRTCSGRRRLPGADADEPAICMNTEGPRAAATRWALPRHQRRGRLDPPGREHTASAPPSRPARRAWIVVVSSPRPAGRECRFAWTGQGGKQDTSKSGVLRLPRRHPGMMRPPARQRRGPWRASVGWSDRSSRRLGRRSQGGRAARCWAVSRPPQFAPAALIARGSCGDFTGYAGHRRCG